MKRKLKDLETYVYIDVSNIRNALRVSDIEIDWNMLYDYLKSVKYIEYKGSYKETIKKESYT